MKSLLIAPTFEPISRQVWYQAIGRGLFQLGSAVLLFYTPLVFVNYGNLSATAVGIAIGGGSAVGFVGNLLGGSLTDSQQFGRRGTLLISAVLAIAAASVAIVTQSFGLLLSANILFGLSVGLYWTAADAAIMDSTAPAQRQRAFSILGVLDNLGFGIGTLGGSLLLKWLHPATLIFAASVVAFLLFLLLVAVAVRETRQGETRLTTDSEQVVAPTAGWKTALQDGRLMTYLLVNTQFVMFIALVGSTLPLYLVNFLSTRESTVSNLFTWGYVGLGAGLQMPLVKLLAQASYLRSLTISMLIWGLGFLLTWLLGASSRFTEAGSGQLLGEFLTFGVFAIATIIYKPTSSAWISELAPASLRGIYTAIAYQCWSLGYIIGPILGGWAMDRSPTVTHIFWLAISVSTSIGIQVLQRLKQQDAKDLYALR